MMKVHTIFWLAIIFFSTNLFTMEHNQKPTKVQLNEIKIDQLKSSNGGSGSSSDLPTVRMMYEELLDKHSPNQSLSTSSNKIAIQKVQPQLEKQINQLKDSDPDLYQNIMKFKSAAEANGTKPEEIQKFIKQNLDQLPPVDAYHVYKHLYNAHLAKDEDERKKNFPIHELLNTEKPVDSSAVYSAVLYRSKSTKLKQKEVIQQETEKAQPCLDEWLNQLKEKDPDMYNIIINACENAKNKEQTEAIQEILDAIDQLNPESLQLLMKDIQTAHQVDQATKEATDTVWSKAYKIIAALVGIFSGISTIPSGTLGGLLGTTKANTIACTLAQCLVIMNQTNSSAPNCTNFTG
jgi:succinate dehydrogenase flavin-adding protein (antitoxin of CptAB toxin-antitoxin module)